MVMEADGLWYESADDREAGSRRTQLLEAVRSEVQSLEDSKERGVLRAYLEVGTLRAVAGELGITYRTVRKQFPRELGKSHGEQRDRIICLEAAIEDLALDEEITRSSAINGRLAYFLENRKLTCELIRKENRDDPAILIDPSATTVRG